MPSYNEIKQMMVENVFPFFGKGGLDNVLSRLDALEEANKKALKDLDTKRKNAAKAKKDAEEKAAKNAVAENKARLERERKEREEKEEALAEKRAKMEIGEDGRAKVVEENPQE